MKKKYYIKRNGTYYLDKTKEEILASIDNNNPDTFIPYLEAMDYPYIEDAWQRRVERCPNETNIFGKYIATMRLRAYRDYTYKDSDFLNACHKRIEAYYNIPGWERFEEWCSQENKKRV